MKKLLLILILITPLFSENIGMIKNVKGTVKLKRDKKIISVTSGYKLKEGDILITKAKSSMSVIFENGTTLALGSKCMISINRYLFKPKKKQFKIDLKITKGKALFNSGRIGKVAPEGIVGIRGTKFSVDVK